MNEIPERYIYVDGEGKARVNWWREGRMGVSYYDDPEATDIVGHEVLAETDERIEFRYGDFEPDEIRSDIRSESFEELLEEIKQRRKNRVHSTAQKKSSSKKKKKKSSKSEEDKVEEKLENLSDKEKELLKQMMEGGD